MDMKPGVLLETGRRKSGQKTISVFVSQVYGGLASLSSIRADTTQLWEYLGIKRFSLFLRQKQKILTSGTADLRY
jgi:hypothetical protein